MSERNIKIVIEYDGTGYSGWQTQKSSLTVQQSLKKAIEEVVGHEVALHGSGRTDSGVHALGQVASFVTTSTIPVENIPQAINSHLRRDVSVLAAEEMPEDFHARYSAKSKVYRYLLLNRTVRTALDRNRCYYFRKPLSMRKMQNAAKLFAGRHDFIAFCAEPGDNTVRDVIRCQVRSTKRFIEFEIEAEGFLYSMVRRIVGTLIEVGRDKLSADDVRALLNDEGGTGGPTAPAQGLYLVEVKY